MLVGDDLVDPRGRPLDLAGLVRHDVVVVLLAGELDRGVPLAQLELVGGLGGAAPQALEEVLERRRDRKISSASGTCSLTTWAPWTSILRITSRPAARASRTWSRGVPYQLPWTSFASRKPPAARCAAGTSRVHEVVVDAVDLARRGARVVQVTT